MYFEKYCFIIHIMTLVDLVNYTNLIENQNTKNKLLNYLIWLFYILFYKL